MKKVFIRSFGCQMNVRDSEVVAGLLKKEGYEITDAKDNADMVIFNTCSVRQHAEDRVWSEIGTFNGRRRPLIGVIGCMARNYQEQIFKRAPQVDFAVGPSDIHKRIHSGPYGTAGKEHIIDKDDYFSLDIE